MNYDAIKLENQLCFPLYACSKEIIRRYRSFLDPMGLTYTQYLVLMALWEEDHVNISQLGARLYLDSGTLTPLLKKMQAQGLIKRERSPEDERNVFVNLTQEGIDLKEKAVLIPPELVKCMDLTDKELSALREALFRLLDQIAL